MIEFGTFEATSLAIVLTTLFCSVIALSIGLFHYKARAEKKALYLRNERAVNDRLKITLDELQTKHSAILAILNENINEVMKNESV